MAEDIVERFLRKTLKNVGWVNKEKTILRSGQPENNLKFLPLYKLFPFKSVINLAWNPANDDDDRDEYRFCLSKGIPYYRFSWGASVPHTDKYKEFWEEQFPYAIELVDTLPKPVWIHCEGGRDRTGGVIAGWKLKHGYLLRDIFADFCVYGMPDESFLINIVEKYNAR